MYLGKMKGAGIVHLRRRAEPHAKGGLQSQVMAVFDPRRRRSTRYGQLKRWRLQARFQMWTKRLFKMVAPPI